MRNFLKPSHLSHSKSSSLIKPGRFQNQDGNSTSLTSANSNNSNHVDNNSAIHISKSVNNDHNSSRNKLFLSRNHVRKSEKVFIRSDNGGKIGLKIPFRRSSSDKDEDDRHAKDSESSVTNDSDSSVDVIPEPSRSNGASFKSHSNSRNSKTEVSPAMNTVRIATNAIKEKVNNTKNCHILSNDADYDVPHNNIHDSETTLDAESASEDDEDEEENSIYASQEEESFCTSPNGRVESSGSSRSSETGADTTDASSIPTAETTPFSSPEKQPENNLHKKPIKIDLSRRTQRKRKPTRPFMPDMIVPKLKIRKQKEESEADSGIAAAIAEVLSRSAEKDQVSSNTDDIDTITTNSISPSELSSSITGTPVRGKSRSRGTGRPRGRPKGSTLKAKAEREAALRRERNEQSPDGSQTESNTDGVSSQTPPDPSIRGVKRRGAPRGMLRFLYCIFRLLTLISQLINVS